MIQYVYDIGQTPLDIEESKALIPNIFTKSELDKFEQENILEARMWGMQKRTLSKNDIFTEKFLLNLHKRMYGQVWKWAGKYRKSNKNIGVEYYAIATELCKLLGDANYWLTNETYTIEELAIVFHHRLVKIHLFPNGNGRHARLCADAISAKYGGEILTWGSKASFAKPDEMRKAYILALREADMENYEPLKAFVMS